MNEPNSNWKPALDDLISIKQELELLRQKVKLVRHRMWALGIRDSQLPVMTNFAPAVDAIGDLLVRGRICPCHNVCGRTYQEISRDWVPLPETYDFESELEKEQNKDRLEKN